MGKKIYGEKISVGMEKRIRYKFILEHLEVKLHIEILSDAAIFLLLRILGIWVEPLGVVLVLLEDRLVLLGLLELGHLNFLQLLLLLLLAFLISAHNLLQTKKEFAMDMVENCIFDSLKGVCAVQKILFL